MILSLLLSVIFVSLALIHFNWVFGGTFGFLESLPTKENGERVLNPSKIESAIVGIGLAAFGVFYLLKTGLMEFTLPEFILVYFGWIIPIIFILRAIGDFKYIGIFKRVKKTPFGKFDSTFFSPLSFSIGFCGIIIQLMK